MGDIERDVIRYGILALGLGLLPVAAELLGLGSWWVLLFLLAGPSGIAALLAVLTILVRRRRDPWMRIAIACGLFALFAFPCIKLSHKSRMVAFGWLASRSDDLVSAIASYEQKTGAPPSSLQSLVPDYLDEVPSTGMPAYPGFEYRIYPPETPVHLYWYDLGSRGGQPFRGLWKYIDGDRENAILVLTVSRDGQVRFATLERMPADPPELAFDSARWRSDIASRIPMVTAAIKTVRPVGKQLRDVTNHLGEPTGDRVLVNANWELSVPCSKGLLNWDVFFYWPGARYPDVAYGGTVERIHDWAYVHE